VTVATSTVLRPATAGDEAFVRRVFLEASNAALASAGLPAVALAGLIELQYGARLAQWRSTYPSFVQYVLERDGEATGVCCLADGDEVRVIDLAVLPSYQRQGIASDVLRQVASRGLPVRLSVWQDDAGARALYAGAGFRAAGDAENGYLELLMEGDMTKAGDHD
jgi:ribosomal protein S18 acetylase RimI-like enzyme